MNVPMQIGLNIQKTKKQNRCRTEKVRVMFEKTQVASGRFAKPVNANCVFGSINMCANVELLASAIESTFIKEVRDDLIKKMVGCVSPTSFNSVWIEALIQHLFLHDSLSLAASVLDWYLLSAPDTEGILQSHYRRLLFLFYIFDTCGMSKKYPANGELKLSKLVFEMVKRYKFLYWTSKKLSRYCHDTLEQFLDRCLRNQEFTDADWIPTERIIRMATAAEDVSLSGTIRKISRALDTAKCTYDQTVFSGNERKAIPETALEILSTAPVHDACITITHAEATKDGKWRMAGRMSGLGEVHVIIQGAYRNFAGRMYGSMHREGVLDGIIDASFQDWIPDNFQWTPIGDRFSMEICMGICRGGIKTRQIFEVD